MLWKQIVISIRMNEHGRKPDQPMHKHLKNCSYFEELVQLYSLPCGGETVDINIKRYLIQRAANKYSSAGHHEQKNKKTTGQIKFSAVTIRQQIKLVLWYSLCK